MISENPIFNMGLYCFVIAIFAVLFEYSIVTGVELGTIEGKVYSISQKPFGGNGQWVRKVNFAKVPSAKLSFTLV